MKIVDEFVVDTETAEDIKKQSEFVFFFSGKPNEEKLFVIPCQKNTNSESFYVELKSFLLTLPLALLKRLNIQHIIVITANELSDFVLEDFFFVQKYNQNNLSFDLIPTDDNYLLRLYKNDFVIC